MERVTSRIPVTFEGEGSGTEELSWGQYELWSAIQRQGSWLPIGAAVQLPPGTTVDDEVATLRFMMSRYQSMRTRLSFDRAGPPRQVLADKGVVPLEVVDADRAADPAQVAAQVEQHYRDTDYDFSAEWPVRMAVVRHQGKLTHRVTVMCHLVTDGSGAAILAQELACPHQATRPSPMPPLAQARWQHTPPALRTSNAALRRWEGLLRTVGARRFSRSHNPRRPRNWEGRFRSLALHLAAGTVAARTKIDVSTLLLTAYAVAIAKVTGVHPVVTQVVVSNRFRPSLAGTVSPVAQTSLCVLDVAGTSFDQAATTAQSQMLSVYKHAYYDRRRLEELITRVERERGERLDLACFFNDRRRGREPAAVSSLDQVRQAQAATAFSWIRRVDFSFERLFLNVEDAVDTIDITVAGDTSYLAPEDLRACVHEMEAIMVAAAFDPMAPTGIAATGGVSREPVRGLDEAVLS